MGFNKTEDGKQGNRKEFHGWNVLVNNLLEQRQRLHLTKSTEKWWKQKVMQDAVLWTNAKNV